MAVTRAILIEDIDYPRVEPYRTLRQPDAFGRRDGGFIAQGEVVLSNAMAAGRYTFSSVLVAERRLDGLAALFARLPVYAAAQDVLDGIAGFSVHRGVLAHGYVPPPPRAEALLDTLPHQAVVIGLVGINDVENMGSIFRNAAAFGASAVLVDATCCDPLYRRAVRVSVGGSLVAPYARLDRGEDLLDLLRGAGFEVLAFAPQGDAPLKHLRPVSRLALLLGAEGPGLSADMLAKVQTVAIPMAGGIDSLNVATASGIALHHVLG